MLFSFVGLAAPAAAQVLPSPWASADIGNPPAAGSATENAGTFTIQASGSDIWGTSDQFHFLYRQVTGDVDVIARIDSLVNVDAWSKAGVMIRSSLAPGAAHGFALVSAGRGLAFQRRRADGAISYHSSGTLTAPPRWTRLVRQGTRLTAYASADGIAWTTLGTDTIALGSTAYVGIAVTSHASGLTTAVASQVGVYPLSLPAGYATSAVGGPTPAGNASYRNGVFTVAAAGGDIWGTRDEFRYVYQQVSGDVDIRARVTSVQYQSKWTKAGVMIRETLTDNSRHGIALLSAGMGYAFQRRPDTGGSSASAAGGSGAAPGWVRIVRTGTAIDAYRSADGTNWTLMGSDTVAMGTNVYVGLAVSSHVPGYLATALFDNVTITTQASGNAAPTVALTAPASGATFTAPASTAVSATATDSDGQISRVDFLANNALIGTDSTAPYSINWSNVQAGTYSVTAVAYDNGGASTESAPAAVTVTGAANQPPTVALTSPTNGAAYVAGSTITMMASASDPEGSLARVDFYANGSLIASDTTAPYSINWGTAGAGTYSLTAVARDAAGNSATSAAVSITVSAAGSWAVSFTASLDHATITRYVLEIFASGANPASATPIATSDLARPTPDANSNISVDRTAFFNGLAAGSYSATVRAENSGGLSRSTPVTFTR